MKGLIVFIIKFVLPAIATIIICLIIGQAMVNDSIGILSCFLQSLFAAVVLGYLASKIYAHDIGKPGKLALAVGLLVFSLVMAPAVISLAWPSPSAPHIGCDAQPSGNSHKYC